MEGFEIAERILRPIVKSILACVFATVIGTLLVICASFLWNWPSDPISVDLFSFGPYAFFSFFFVTVLGLPLQALLQKFKLNGWRIIVFAGSLAGLCLGAFIDSFFQTEERQGYGPVAWELSHVEWSLYAYGAALGALYSGLAWLIRRPDKDVKPLP